VQFEVADNGAGITPESQAKIFDPFFTTRLGRGGSGLGLHIVYSIVTRVLGGRISFSSKAGEGTRFVLVLPRVAPTANNTANT
jgi:signal transduction histidine kinase